MERLRYRGYQWRRGQSAALVIWIILLVLLMFHDADAQIRDLAGTRYAVRAIMTEPSTTYLVDSTLNRFINIAHRETILALGERTAIKLDTIVTTNRVTRYELNTDCGSVFLPVLKKLSGDEVSLIRIDPSQMGKIGQGQQAASYFQPGDYMVLGQSPEGGETLFVYYVPIAKNLDVDTTSLQNADDDDQAVVWLAASMVCERDRQLELAQQLRLAWEFHLRLKGIGSAQSTQVAP